ncbi:60S acidic ribosomal protein P2 isoform X1 [Hypomesus transpacificus]|uniref:60S acidic ribosomal protein P2 isoform X1 n=1 Tax=Hypomesus transpacificus TaxID=137520 RepID=UPI001F07C4FF|nr:60S acidic ribosomal protein P2 isoform X1 [Hypomesus transpacificus]
MRYVAAYLLAVLGGNTSPSSKDIKTILGSVGIEAEDVRLDKVITELNGKDINEASLSWPPCQQVALLQLLLLLVEGLPWQRLLLRKRKRRKRRRNLKNLMKIWALDSLINFSSTKKAIQIEKVYTQPLF